MAEQEEIQTTNVNLILGPRGVRLDENGRIRFVDPEILQAIVTGVRPDLAKTVAAADNYFQCGANNYQCGKGAI